MHVCMQEDEGWLDKQHLCCSGCYFHTQWCNLESITFCLSPISSSISSPPATNSYSQRLSLSDFLYQILPSCAVTTITIMLDDFNLRWKANLDQKWSEKFACSEKVFAKVWEREDDEWLGKVLSTINCVNKCQLFSSGHHGIRMSAQ